MKKYASAKNSAAKTSQGKPPTGRFHKIHPWEHACVSGGTTVPGPNLLKNGAFGRWNFRSWRLTMSYWCVTQARQGWTSILRSALNLLEKRVQTLSAKFPELKIDNVLLMCYSGEAGMNKHLALNAEDGWTFIGKTCSSFVSQLRQR